LDNEKVLRQFDEIEQKVGKVIDVCKSLEATNLEFKTKIERLEEELQGKVEAENNYQEEKALIRSRVDSLLVRLEGLTETE
jgi:protein-arginine kinase activator protein McsA